MRPFFLLLFLFSSPAFAQTSKPATPPSKPATPPPQTPCVCPLIFLPVCGADQKTYSNSCLARCSKIPILCQGSCPCKGSPSPAPACACPRVLKPICATNGRNYMNGCFAACAGVEIACRGLCPCPSPASKPAPR